MTLRAVLLGLVGAVCVCAYTHFNDFVVRQTLFVGNHLPYSVYGGLIIFLIVLNPLLYYASKRLALTGRELAVVLTLTLAACVVPGSGLLTTFTTSLMMPHHLSRTEPGWKEHGVVCDFAVKLLSRVYTDGPETKLPNEGEIAVEVETGDSDIRHNIEADLKADFSYVLSVPTNPRAERKTSEFVARERYGDKVRVVPARMFKIKARPA